MYLIKPQEFIHFIPTDYQRYADIGPYMIPIFGKMYFERIRYIISKLIKSNISPLKVLDVGAGFGFFSVNFKLNFPKCDYCLLDLYPNELLDIVRRIMDNKLKLEFSYSFESDIQKKTHFEDSSFDLTLALDVLEHLNDPELALSEILRITKPNGYIFISVPTESNILKFFRMVEQSTVALSSFVISLSVSTPTRYRGRLRCSRPRRIEPCCIIHPLRLHWAEPTTFRPSETSS